MKRYIVDYFMLGRNDKTGKMLYQFMIIDTHKEEPIRRFVNYESGEYRTFKQARAAVNAECTRLNAEYRKEQI